jgi:selenocysteine-specific elongation factor
MAKLIGTAGHVDHGKTTLIRSLTGIDADRLPEEKQRGMTIDVGFAFIDLPRHGRVSIVDVPGHERFLSNMLVGALGIDVAMLCVSADESVMPQTREHFQILELLPVERMVVALTRADLADEETRFIARSEVEELLEGTRFAGSPIVEVSAHTGEGLPALRDRLEEALDGSDAPRPGPWYLPIDRVFTVKGHGCVVTGTLAQGQVRIGDRGVVVPGNHEVRVRAIHTHGDAVEASEKGRRTALNLSGLKAEDVRRGQALGAPGALFESEVVDVRMVWVGPFKHGQRVRVSVGAEEAIGKLFLNEHDPSLAQLRLETAVPVALDQPLVVRNYSPPTLVGGGRVVVPQARVRRRTEAPMVAGGKDDAEAILEILRGSPLGVPTEEICRVLGKTPQALGDTFETVSASGAVCGFAGLWFNRESFDAAAERFLAALGELHEKSPTQATVPRDRVSVAAGLPWSGKPLDRIVAALASEGRLGVHGHGVKLATFHVRLTPRQREFLDRVKESLSGEPLNVPGIYEVASDVKAPPQAVEEILRVGVQAGEIVSIGDGIHYTREQIEELKRRIREFGGGKPFTAAMVRDGLGTSRKYAIPLLEYLDSIRFTVRVGDQRVVSERE